MERIDRDLLLRDLCSRIPYGVVCEGYYMEESGYGVPYGSRDRIVGNVDGIDHIGFDDGEVYVIIDGIPCELSDVRCFLRSMDSMDDEERKCLKTLVSEDLSEFGKFIKDGHGLSHDGLYMFDKQRQLDWLLKNHFDFSGIIDKGLALEAQNGMYSK